MYVYIRSEPGLWTVGFYTPDGKWEAESDHPNSEEAAKRVVWLNGLGGLFMTELTDEEFEALRRKIHETIILLIELQKLHREQRGQDYVISGPLNPSLDWGLEKSND